MKPIRSLSVYESREVLLFIGRITNESDGFQVLELNRTNSVPGSKLFIDLHSHLYSAEELEVLIRSRKVYATLKDVFCLFGFVQLIESYYAVVVTKADVVANIDGHVIYTIADASVVSITYKARNTIEETRYKRVLQNLDLTQGFYFSYSYDLSRSLQDNLHRGDEEISSSAFSWMLDGHDETGGNMFAWNLPALQLLINAEYASSLSSDIRQQLEGFMVPIIYGYVKQNAVQLIDNNNLKFTLIGRRSRLFAGTRYLRRGVSEDGYTANEVETEQIVTVEIPAHAHAPISYASSEKCFRRSSSLVQLRGSIPLYWQHTNMFIPNPGITVKEEDRGYSAAYKHFVRLFESYGDYVAVLNLVRQSGRNRETEIAAAYDDLCAALNYHFSSPPAIAETVDGKLSSSASSSNEERPQQNDRRSSEGPIEFVSFDFHGAASADFNTFDVLKAISLQLYPQIGFFVQAPPGCEEYLLFPIEQDCLDTCDSDKSLAGILDRYPNANTNTGGMEAEEEEQEVVGEDDKKGNDYRDELLSDSEERDKGHGKSERRVGSHGFKEATVVAVAAVSVVSTAAKTATETRKKAETMTETSSETRAEDKSAANDEDEARRNSGSTQIKCKLAGVTTLVSISTTSNTENEEEDLLYNNNDEEQEQHHTAPCPSGATTTATATAEAVPVQTTSTLFGTRVGSGACRGLLQGGVLRTNCIDCLDRTNVGQFCFANVVLPRQIKAVGIQLAPTDMRSVRSLVMEMWSEHGDVLARQYAGSGAMHRVDASKGSFAAPFTKFFSPAPSSGSQRAGSTESNETGGHAEDHQGEDAEMELTLSGGATNAIVAVQRYYSNISSDFERQQAFDLLLGLFVPKRGAPAIWDVNLNKYNDERGGDSQSLFDDIRRPIPKYLSWRRSSNSATSNGCTVYQLPRQSSYTGYDNSDEYRGDEKVREKNDVRSQVDTEQRFVPPVLEKARYRAFPPDPLDMDSRHMEDSDLSLKLRASIVTTETAEETDYEGRNNRGRIQTPLDVVAGALSWIIR